MSKTNNMRDDRKGLRWQLLVTVSAAALLASSYGAEAANEDSDRPLLWIELGGQLDQLSNKQETLTPPFMGSIIQPGQLSALDVQRPTAFAIDAEGKISFQPENSDWAFSAAVRYGRSHANRANHQQTRNPKIPFDWTIHFGSNSLHRSGSFYPSSHVKFADGRSHQNENHLILDFEAGKDVGLGRFGEHGTSLVSAGVRIAQFGSRSNVALRAEPDVNYPSTPLTTFFQYRGFKYNNSINFHDYAASETVKRNFNGVGPKFSWDASATIAGNGGGEITFDWGLDAAVLFGRQTAVGHHQTTTKTYHMTHWTPRNGQGGPYDNVGYFGWGNCGCQKGPVSQHTNAPPGFDRSRSVTVPNLGGFAGLSYRYSDAKISLGYRADFFFNAIDGGIDTRKSTTRGFYGPFASISVGVGD